jgi:Tol biopolymer transport system component
MTDLQWQRAKEITADALERDPASRFAFVHEACGSDAEVCQEVLRLLKAAEASDCGFLSTPACDVHQLLGGREPRDPRFTPGQELAGRFRIERFLGLGGMGEVYAAFDRELRELVALKTVRPAISWSRTAIERFKAEVKESRRVTHSCVCRVYDLFSHDQPDGDPLWFLTMELLEGQTLQEVLTAKGPLPLNEALPLVEDMTAALAAAHAIGLVHRDFKPGNVMLVKGKDRTRAVVTDFGLAQQVTGGSTGDRVAADGTPAYMAPEQVAGEGIGFQTDQYALGLVLCEILTGSRPELDRTSATESRRQLREWMQGRPRRALSVRARETIRRALEFQLEDRFRQVRDIVPALTGTRRRRLIRRAAAAAVATLGLTAALVAPGAGNGPRVKDAVRMTPESGLSNSASISRDGKWIAYSSDRGQPGNLDIWVQGVAGGAPRRLTVHPAVENQPALSPDGSLVAFRSERDGGGLYLAKSDGSDVRLLAAGGWNPVFSPDGRSIAYWTGTRDEASPSAQVYVASTQGGEPRRLAANFADARYPTWDSTGRFLLFDGCPAKTAALALCTEWWVMRADGSEPRNTGALALVKSQKIELTTPPLKLWWRDQVLFSGERGLIVPLWALRLNGGTFTPVGVPKSITPGDAGEREAGIAEDGSIVYGRIIAALHIWRTPLAGGAPEPAPVTDDPALDGCPSISRDGRLLYFTRKIRGVRQLLVRNLTTHREALVFSSDENKFWPIASADGTRVAFERRGQAESSIWLIENGGAARQLCSACSYPTSWHGAGQAIFYTKPTGEIGLLDVRSGATRVVLAPEPGMVLGGADWSPANQHLLFTVSRQGAGKQVFAVRFPAKGETAEGPWIPLTRETAEVDQPHWAADGKAFYFLSKRDASNCLWGKPFSTAAPAAGAPFAVLHFHDLRRAPDRASTLTRGLTVSADSVFLSVGEVYDALWLGKLTEPKLLSWWMKLPFWR